MARPWLVQLMKELFAATCKDQNINEIVSLVNQLFMLVSQSQLKIRKIFNECAKNPKVCMMIIFVVRSSTNMWLCACVLFVCFVCFVCPKFFWPVLGQVGG